MLLPASERPPATHKPAPPATQRMRPATAPPPATRKPAPLRSAGHPRTSPPRIAPQGTHAQAHPSKLPVTGLCPVTGPLLHALSTRKPSGAMRSGLPTHKPSGAERCGLSTLLAMRRRGTFCAGWLAGRAFPPCWSFRWLAVA